jgi:cytochrome c biogenesis protein CcmG/thiol:disulfide interchange protein DsbE
VNDIAQSRGSKILTGAAVLAVVAALAFLWDTDSGRPTPLKPVAERKPAGAFELRTIDGGTWRLSDNSGKVVLINFWATWCGPCRQETPDLVRVANEYRSHGFEIAGVAVDNAGPDAIRRFARRYEVPYAMLVSTAALAAEIQVLPTSLLVDRRGRVAKVYQGAITQRVLRSDVEQLLAESF